MTADIIYKATKTASLFHNDDSFVRILFGPVGCGKSVAGMMEVMSRALRQEAGTDGIRRTKWAIIRNTYPDLKSTTIATWREWYPEEQFGPIKWDSPIKHHLKFPLEDGTKVDCEVLFVAMDGPEDVRKLMSFELTGIYINELQFINYKVFEKATERVNRFPPKILGAAITWTGVIADTNPPDTDHWIYQRVDMPRPKGYKMFKYASPLKKITAEEVTTELVETSLNGTLYTNDLSCDYRIIQNDSNYWIKLVSARLDEEIRVNQMGEYGYVQDGKAVHSTYNDQLHFANRILSYNPQLELGLGWDFGLTPACAIVQLTPRGQLQVIGELWSEDMGLRDFASNIVIPHLDQFYSGWRKNYCSRHDPAGNTGSQTDGKSCRDILQELDINSTASANNNDPTPRRDGLKYFLSKLVDGMPAYIVSLKCPMIRKGLMGAFKYARVKVGGEERYHDKPLKNIYSHICEGLEYIAMNYAAENKKPPDNNKKPYVISRGKFI